MEKEHIKLEETLKKIRIALAHEIFIATIKWLLDPKSTTDSLEEIIDNIFYRGD